MLDEPAKRSWREALLVYHESVTNDRQRQRLRWVIGVGADADQQFAGINIEQHLGEMRCQRDDAEFPAVIARQRCRVRSAAIAAGGQNNE